MTPCVRVLGEFADVTWTVRCASHSDPEHGIHVCACGAATPDGRPCPCEVGDRYVVVEAARAGRRWRECADVLICPAQPGLSAALCATNAAIARFPGCTLAVASACRSDCVLRNRKGTVFLARCLVAPTLLAAYAHLDHLRDHDA